MADRVVAMETDAEGTHYLWDSGWRVTFNPQTQRWTRFLIAHPTIHERWFDDAPTLNREASPEVACDD